MKLNNPFDRISHRSYQSLLITLLVLALFVFSGCASSDGGSDDDDEAPVENSLLEGTYFDGFFSVSTGGTLSNTTAKADYDGAGSYDWEILYSSEGDTGSFPGNYTTQEDGKLTYIGSDARGIVSEDGTILSYIDTEKDGTDGDIYLGMNIEKSTGRSAADVSGDYIVCQIRYQDNDRVHTSYSRFTFNGDASFDGQILSDSDDATGNVSGNYAVSNDGSLDIDLASPVNKTFQGQISADGRSILFLDDDADSEVVLMAGFKKTTGADNSLLNGEYQVNLFGGDGDGHETARGKVTADGEGNATITIISHSEGVSGSFDVTYTVDNDGTVVFNDAPGIVSADGNIMIAAVIDSEGDDVKISVMIKKH